MIRCACDATHPTPMTDVSLWPVGAACCDGRLQSMTPLKLPNCEDAPASVIARRFKGQNGEGRDEKTAENFERNENRRFWFERRFVSRSRCGQDTCDSIVQLYVASDSALGVPFSRKRPMFIAVIPFVGLACAAALPCAWSCTVPCPLVFARMPPPSGCSVGSECSLA